MKAFLAALVLFALATAPSAGAGLTVLSDGRTLFVATPAGTPRGVILLVPGGDSQLRIGAGGEPAPSGNFVIRTRKFWTDAGYAIAYLSDPTDLREPMAQLRAIARPVVIVSTSRGTIVAAQSAARLGTDGPDKIVLTSPVTSGGPGPNEKRPGIANSLADVNVRPVAIPTLIVTNDGDSCHVSTAGGAAALAKRFTPPAQMLHVESHDIRSAPCDAFSPHGFLGIEDDVLGKTLAWISASR